MKMLCPHCKQHAYTRSSRQLTVTSRETFFQCRNLECGHTFTAVTEINHTISPSATPDPTVVIPLSSHIKRSLLSHLLQSMPTSSYTPVCATGTLDLFEAAPSG